MSKLVAWCTPPAGSGGSGRDARDAGTLSPHHENEAFAKCARYQRAPEASATASVPAMATRPPAALVMAKDAAAESERPALCVACAILRSKRSAFRPRRVRSAATAGAPAPGTGGKEPARPPYPPPPAAAAAGSSSPLQAKSTSTRGRQRGHSAMATGLGSRISPGSDL
jgi:hypothetical protein